MTCLHHTMRPGVALQSTLTGVSDFAGGEVSTVSEGGPGRLISCLKCADCGYSVTAIKNVEIEQHIHDCGELMKQAYMDGLHQEARRWLQTMYEAVKSRPANAVPHHSCYFHEMGAADALRLTGRTN